MKLKYYEIDENELLKKIGNEKKVVIKLPGLHKLFFKNF